MLKDSVVLKKIFLYSSVFPGILFRRTRSSPSRKGWTPYARPHRYSGNNASALIILQVISLLFFVNSKHFEQIKDVFSPHSRLHFPFTTVYPSLGNLDFYPHEEEDWGGAGGGGGGGGMAVRKKKGEEDEEEEDEELDGRRGKPCITLPILNFSVSGVNFFMYISNV